MKPFVTVLIDTYNHEKFIEQAIASVLEQDVERKDIEILVIDDGSTDRTPEIIQKFASQLRYLRKPNGGQASAFNVGIPEARGEIIAFLDGDDWWAKNKLSRVLEVLEQQPEVGSVGHGITITSANGYHQEIKPPHSLQYRLSSPQDALSFLSYKCLLGTSRFTARKKILEKILPIPESLVVEADEYMFTLLPTLADVIILEDILTYYRLHDNNLYQFRSYDKTKVHRKARVMTSLLEDLPPRLIAWNVSKQTIDCIMEPIWISTERHRLSVSGGSGWETFQVERTALRARGDGKKLNSQIWRMFILGLSLLLPPRLFYQLKQWYSFKLSL